MARTVVVELAGKPALARDLAAGGILVPDVLEVGEEIELSLRAGQRELRVGAKCVWVGPTGAGLQLHNCDADMKQRIASLAQTISAPAAAPVTEAEAEPGEAAEPASEDAGEPTPDGDDNGDGDGEGEARKIALNVHERLRGLTLAQQVKIAHHGEVSERIVLERIYGKNVWEALLRNPRLTGPEVARLARMGSLPRPLMEIIVGNGGWLQIPEVRRALLANPRLGTDHIMKILRMLPKHELKLAAMQTAYPHAVRDVAKRLLKEAGGG